MKRWKKHPNFIKGMCLVLVGALVITSVVCLGSDTLEVSAANNTLPGIEQLRDDYISNTKTYRILEVVPELEAAEMGYYIGGQEPFTTLYDEEKGEYVAWQELLLEQITAEDREHFMASLLAEAEMINAYYEEAGICLFDVEEYVEYEEGSQPEDSTRIAIDGKIKRGYLQPGAGEWDAVFTVLEDRDISLDAVNHSVTTPYYKVSTEDAVFTYQELKDFAEVSPLEDIYILRPEGYWEYMGKAQEVWEETEIYLEELMLTVSGNGVSGGNSDVSTGDALDALWNSSSGFCSPVFNLVGYDNPAVAGDQVYLMSEALYAGEDKGHYALVETVERERPGEPFAYETTYLYFTGGVKNHEVFKTQVFGLTEQECDKLRISVETVTPAMLGTLFETEMITKVSEGVELFADYDLVYINGGSAMKEIKGLTGIYSAANDISSMVMASLGMYISVEKIPCIFDLQPFVEVLQDQWYSQYSLKMYEGEEIAKTTNVARLGNFLAAPSFNAEGNDIAAGCYNTDLSEFIFQKLRNLDCVEATNESLFGTDELPNREDEGVQKLDASLVIDHVWFICNEPSVKEEDSLQNRGLFSEHEYALEQIKSGFYEVWKEIVVENMYLAEQGEELLDTRIYDTSAMRYIINFCNQRQMSKERLNVLVVEPAGRVSTVSAQDFTGLTGIEAGKITFHVMAMNEFVGRIEDLNATYDVIYFDSNTTGLVTKNGETVYNDSSMDGLLYSHVGDAIEAFASISGLLDTDYTDNSRASSSLKETTVHRYSGNDLSVEKYNALVDYLDANYPIVISSDLLVEDGTEVNDKRVDNSSYLYEFLSEILMDGSRKNIFVSDTLSENKSSFAFYANRPKLSLYSEEYPELIMTGEKYRAEGELNSNVTVIASNNGRYYLQYDFMIKNDSAANFGDDYTCKLYLDANADGKFSEGYEELSLSPGNIVEVETGQAVESTSKLKVGVRYQVSREVPDSFFGCITWQLEVSQTGCPSVRTQHKGYTKLAGSEAAYIKILQIYYHTDKRVINLEQSIGHFKNGAYDNSGMAYVTNHFKTVAQNVSDEYVLDIKTISKEVFDTGYFDESGGEEPIILNEYDMLILGFSDGNNTGMDWNVGIDTNLPCVDEDGNVIKDNNISHFIESGKSVLFAHDMTSTINVPDYGMTIGSSLEEHYRVTENRGRSARSFYYDASNSFSEYAWGYNINNKLRNLVGMDAYGVSGGSNFAALKSGIPLEKVGVDSNVEYSNGNLSLTAPYKNGDKYVYGVHDVAFAPDTERKSTVSHVQGFTAYALNMRVYADSDNMSYYRSGLAPNRSNYYSSSAEKVNDGQITNYPYLISDTPSLAKTHQQYYTLDLNADSDLDQETDIVVWYNLTGDGYNSAPGDVKNNYYIYSKGNVIYTGMGHAASGKSSDPAPYANAVTLEEAKLFINTMVAAYNAGQRNPEIITMSAGGIQTDVVYNYYDSLITESEAGIDYSSVTGAEDKVEVFYRVNDLNITQGTKEVELHYYMEVEESIAQSLMNAGGYTVIKAANLPDSGSEMSSDQYLVEVTDYLIPYTYTDSGERVQLSRHGRLYPDLVYRVEIPLKYFDTTRQGYRSGFYIGGRTVMTNSSIVDGKEVTSYTPYVYAKLQCVNVELFDLD